ncbi:MAG TPA: sortase [Candidatus Saccharimonadales bacterium]|nr:sortase [Candidatus Saccharimonadales bacterium]
MFKPTTYVKDNSRDPLFNPINTKFALKSRVLPIAAFVAGGAILVTQVIFPLVVFKTQDVIAKPISNSVLGKATGFSDFEFTELQSKESSASNDANVPKYFYLTIPKLNINKAFVETNSESLSPDTALGHYKGTALPGKVGTAFIYGHSVLPWFFNPRNYKTIFSTLNNLETGDVFYIDYNNERLTYKVESKEIKKAAQVDPLAELKPRYLNESTIVLMSCYPAGTTLKRLMINAVKV